MNKEIYIIDNRYFVTDDDDEKLREYVGDKENAKTLLQQRNLLDNLENNKAIKKKELKN